MTQTIKEIVQEYRNQQINQASTPIVEISDMVEHAKKIKKNKKKKKLVSYLWEHGIDGLVADIIITNLPKHIKAELEQGINEE